VASILPARKGRVARATRVAREATRGAPATSHEEKLHLLEFLLASDDPA